MKKLVSLCLTFILIAGSIGTVAYAEETLPDLLFDMDIQVAEDGTYTIKDASPEKNSIGYVQPGIVPILGTNNWNTNYIQIGELDENGAPKNTHGTIYVDLGTDRNTEGGANDSYANKDELAFETWVNVNYWENHITASSWRSVFGLAGRYNGKDLNSGIKGAVQPNFAFNTQTGKITVDLRPDITLTKWSQEEIDEKKWDSQYVGSYKGNTNGTVTNSNNIADSLTGGKWVHMVIVRKWTPKNNGTPAGKWNYDLYINGENVGSVDAEVDERVDYNNVSHNGSWVDYDALILGRPEKASKANANDPIIQMADFKMYDGVLTEAQILRNYESTRTGFMDVTDVKEETIEALSKLTRDDAGKTFEVKFTNSVDAATVAKGSILIKDEEGNEVATELVSYDEATYTATLKLVDYFAYGRTYKLCLPGVKDLSGAAVARTEIEFTTAVKTGVEVTAVVPTITATTAKVDLMLKNTDENPLTVGMFIMVYRDGKIEKLAMTKGDAIKTITAGGTATVTVTADGIQEGDEIRSMAYSVVEGKGRIAFTSPVELTVE